MVARRQVGGIVESSAPPAGVRQDHHQIGTALAQPPGLGLDGGRERRRAKPLDVGGERLGEPVAGHDAHDANPEARDVDDRGRPDVRPLDRAFGDLVDQIRREKRKPCADGHRLQRTAHVGRPAVSGRGITRSVLELMVADGQRVVAQRVVGVDDECSFRQIGFDPSLEGVTRVQEQHRAAVDRACRA